MSVKACILASLMCLLFDLPVIAMTIRFETGLDGKVTNQEHWMPVTLILDRESGDPHGIFRLHLELIPSGEDAPTNEYDVPVAVPDQPRIVFRTHILKPRYAFRRYSMTTSGEINAAVFAPDKSMVYEGELPFPTIVDGGAIKVWLSSHPEPADVLYDFKVRPESLLHPPLDLDCARIVITDEANYVKTHAEEFLAWQSVRPRGLVVIMPSVGNPGSLGLSPSFSRPTWVGPWNDTHTAEMISQLTMTPDANLDEYSVRQLADGKEFVQAAKKRIVGAGMIYALVCLPAVLAYFRFRKRGEQLAWAIPVLAFSSGAVIFLLAWLLHGREFVSKTDTVIYHDDHAGLARSNKVWTVKAPASTNLDVLFGRDEIGGIYAYFDRRIPGLGRTLIRRDDTHFSFSGLRVGQWSKRVALLRKEWRDTPLCRHVALDGEKIVIGVQNTTDESQTVFRSGWKTIGRLGPSESARWVLDLSDDTEFMPETEKMLKSDLLYIAHSGYEISSSGFYLTFACDRPFDPPELRNIQPINLGQTLRIERISQIDEIIGAKGRIRHALLAFPTERYERYNHTGAYRTASFKSGGLWNKSYFVAPALPGGARISAVNFHMQDLPFKGSYLFTAAAPFWNLESEKQVDADTGVSVDVSLPVAMPGNTLVEYGIYYLPPEEPGKKSKFVRIRDDDDQLSSYHLSLDVNR